MPQSLPVEHTRATSLHISSFLILVETFDIGSIRKRYRPTVAVMGTALAASADV